MLSIEFHEDDLSAISDILGYLNFSSGQEQPRFEIAWNRLYQILQQQGVSPLWKSCEEILLEQLTNLSKTRDAFRHISQAKFVIEFLYHHFIPAYKEFHQDLLYHQSEEFYLNSFFVARLSRIILQNIDSLREDFSQQTEEEKKKKIDPLLRQANDFLGYRPTTVLEGEKRHEPNPHEWVGAVPLYRKEAGVAVGRYEELIRKTINILRDTDPVLLRDAWFDPDKLIELAMDPRAFDFDHPVNRRPNYYFGTWDPHVIDQEGYFRRFVVQQVTVDSILARVEEWKKGEIETQITVSMGNPQEKNPTTIENATVSEIMDEAAAVLAGTILMGSGVSGDRVQAHDSSVTLSTLMPQIASYRDRFYELLLQKIPAPARIRLEAEAKNLFQPFARARQDLNRKMGRNRAEQLMRTNLARLYARMGYFDAAEKQTQIISVASARILCRIDCLITESYFKAEAGELRAAAEMIPEVETLIHRGIACGALPDPWTLLGFGAQYTIFSAENTIHDHRIDDFINLLNDLFDHYSRLLKDAAALGDEDLQADLSDRMSDLAGWWDQFGSTEVSSVEGFSGQEAWESAAKVATSLAAWHLAGTAAGDVAFWNRHVARFNSPKAYVLLGEALLDKKDLVSSSALLTHWLSRNEEVPLTEGDFSFHSLTFDWFETLWDEETKRRKRKTKKDEIPPITFEKYKERWKLTRTFLERLEANAGIYWDVPELEILQEKKEKKSSPRPRGEQKFLTESDFAEIENPEDLPEDDLIRGIDPLYQAAYEQMSFRDSAEDGIDDDMMESASGAYIPSEDEFAKETDRINERLAFIFSLMKLWGFAAGKSPLIYSGEIIDGSLQETDLYVETKDLLEGWLKQSKIYEENLNKLLEDASNYYIAHPRGTSESLMEYDHQHGTKEILLDRIIRTLVEVKDITLLLSALLDKEGNQSEKEESLIVQTFSAIFHSQTNEVKRCWKPLLVSLRKKTLLYVPTSRGGQPQEIVRCRSLQQTVMHLLEYAPELGLLTKTFELLSAVQTMDRIQPGKMGAITEFDRIFEIATRAITKSIAESSRRWRLSAEESHLMRKKLGFKESANPSRHFTATVELGASKNSTQEPPPITSQDDTGANDVALIFYMEQVMDILLACWLSHSQRIRISSVEGIMQEMVWDKIKKFIQKYGADLFTQDFLNFRNLRAILHQGVGQYLNSLIAMYKKDQELEFGEVLIDDLANERYSISDATFFLERIFESVAENFATYIDYNSTTTHSDHGEKLYMFLDMLRVLTQYERISWNLKPVYWVHQVLIRSGYHNAGALWEDSIERRSIKASDGIIKSYRMLCDRYGIQLPSIYERLNERFIRPLQIDRMCGMVPEVIHQAKSGHGENEAFHRLEQQVEFFAERQTGIGFEVPEWLHILQNETADQMSLEKEKEGPSREDIFAPKPVFHTVKLTRADLDRQVAWAMEHISFRENFD